jgi:hypothetical protein
MYIARQNSAVLFIEVLTKITVVPLLYLKSDGLVELAGIVIGLSQFSQLWDPACCASNEPATIGLCSTGHFAPKQNYQVLKNNKIN